jgi:Flp pilus assembly pilin Flp
MHAAFKATPSRPQAIARTKIKEITFMVNLARRIAARLHKDNAGQGLVEYALIMALVVFAAVSTMQGLAKEINLAFSQVTATLTSAVTASPTGGTGGGTTPQ